MKKIKVYLDMDGTLSKIPEDPNYLDKIWEPGFFESLEVSRNIIEAVKLLRANSGVSLCILSATVRAQEEAAEKTRWLSKHLGVDPEEIFEHLHFVSYGSSKADFIAEMYKADEDLSDAELVLIDDYNHNLEQWKEAGWHAVKFVNETNDKGLNGPIWTGDRIYCTDTPEKMVEKILQICKTTKAEFEIVYTVREKLTEEIPSTVDCNDKNAVLEYLLGKKLKTTLDPVGSTFLDKDTIVCRQ